MDFQQLHTFVTAAKLLSFSKTAELLGYSQAAVTIQIKQLETKLGSKLFDRIGKNSLNKRRHPLSSICNNHLRYDH